MSNLGKLQQGNLTPAINYYKIAAIFVGIALVSVGVVLGYLHYQSKQHTPQQKQELAVASSYVPDGFYPTFNNATLNDKKEQTDQKQADKQKVVVVEKTQQYGQAQVNMSAVTEVKSNEDKAKESKLTAEEAFIKQQLDLAKELQEQRRALLLARRGKQSDSWQEIETIETLKKREAEALKPPTDKDFGIAKDESTYPVDLSRVVTADRHIPCILIDQINSQLEGRVTCSVERNVYGYHGRNILIPAGSKIMGSHGTLKKVGDERFNIHFKRLLRPDGAHVNLTDAYASDLIGGTGVEGVVNRRRWEKYGGAILTSTVSVLAQIPIQNEGSTVSNTIIQGFGTDIGRVTAAMLQESINIKPYSVVPAGTRIQVTPVTDIWLKDVDGQLSFQAINQQEDTQP